MLFSQSIRFCWTPFRSLQRPLAHARFFSVLGPRYSVEMGTVDTTDRLTRLRQLMQENKVDVYSTPSFNPMCDGRAETHVRIKQLFPLRIAINPSTLRRVMLVEVSDRPSFSRSTLSAYHCPCRVHFWFLGLRRYRDHLHDQGRSVYGRTVLQPGREAIGQQLGAA